MGRNFQKRVLYTWLEQYTYVGMDINICRRNTAGVNTLKENQWDDGRYKLKGKVLTSCITPPYIYGLETMEFVLKICQSLRR